MKIRVFSLAKELNLDSKVLLDYLSRLGVTLKPSALASITEQERDQVLALMREDKVGQHRSPHAAAGVTTSLLQSTQPPGTNTARSISPDTFKEASDRISRAAVSRSRELDLSRLDLDHLPSSLFRLPQLRSLRLDGNRLQSLPKELGQLRLTHLSVEGSGLTEFPAVLMSLNVLEELSVSNNLIKSIPKWLNKLHSLQVLNLSRNLLINLRQCIGNLYNLRILDCSFNCLTAIPYSMVLMRSLELLDLSSNNIESFPNLLADIRSLRVLILAGNRLNSIPNSLKTHRSLSHIFLHGNDALKLPPGILGSYWTGSITDQYSSAEEILDYYFRARNATAQLNEGKLILVGRGGAGKTSVAMRLISNTFDQQQQETQGIEIRKWDITVGNNEQVILHVWDFGGQEILHSTHQFFLTERAVYLLVLSGREGAAMQDAEYWLQMIKSFGGTSSVIIVLNKITQHRFDVNRGFLLEKYPFIKHFVKVDCACIDDGKDAHGISDLRGAIISEIDKMEDRKTLFPAEWVIIKKRLSGTAVNYLTWDSFQQMCVSLGESDPIAQKKLAGHLHLLGIALHYADDPRLRDTHVLNPNWITAAVYSILRSGRNRSHP